MAVLVYLALFKLLVHFLTNGQYDYSGDEFYYIAASERLDFGYVDFPPLAPVIARITRWLLGDSLFALRFFPAVAGALIVFFTGLIARELGGTQFAQALAAVTVIVGPTFLGNHTLFTVNAFDQLFWVLSAYIILLLLKRANPKLWLLFGLVSGVGLMTKMTMLFFGFGVFVALVLTPNRKYLLNKWFWLAGLLAFLIFLPYIIWQITHGWPTLEFYTSYAQGNTSPVSPTNFLYEQIMTVHPFTLPVWLAGLYYYFFSYEGKPYRLLGWIYIVLYIVFNALQVKFYFLSPAFPMLFASGAIVIENFIRQRNWIWLKAAYATILIIGGIMTAPLALPVLPIETFIKYSSFVGGDAGVKIQRHEAGTLPQHYADMFGWKNMVATVARVYHRLSPDEQSKACIAASSSWEAGAINFFGKTDNLPKAISGHNNYYLWGPGNCTGEIVVSVGERLEDLKGIFKEVEQAEIIRCEYCRPDRNNLPVYISRGLSMSVEEAWSKYKHYD